MSTTSTSADASNQANAWLLVHLTELRSRAGVRLARLRPESREEALAEILALTLAWAHSAAQRGVLGQLTPYWCVTFALRQWWEGRRAAGYSSRCVMSEVARVKRGIKVTSLEAPDDSDPKARASLAECLADHDAEDPFEVVRRQEDYPTMLDGSVSLKARRVFGFLVETKSEGRQSELAQELGVSAPRVTQLKGELATAMGRHGYAGQMGWRPSRHTPSPPLDSEHARGIDL